MTRQFLMGVLMLATWGKLPADTALPFARGDVIAKDMAQEQLFDATVEAVNQSTVSAQVAGRVEAIYVDVNDYVQKDAVLLRLRNSEQRAGKAAAQAQIKETRARYQEAAAEFNRMQTLYARRLVAQSAFDKASANLKASRGQLDAALAGVAQAEEQLGHTEIRAPYTGIVVERHVEVGETVSPGQALVTSLSLDALRAVAEVPQTIVTAVRTRHSARVLLPDAPAGSVVTTGITLFPYADPKTHNFKVRVTLPPGVRGIYPGMLIKVAFTTGERNVTLVAARAIVHRSEVTAVYVIDKSDRVSLRQIRTGRSYGTNIEVLAGLQAGEQVALDPIRAGVYLKERNINQQ